MVDIENQDVQVGDLVRRVCDDTGRLLRAGDPAYDARDGLMLVTAIQQTTATLQDYRLGPSTDDPKPTFGGCLLLVPEGPDTVMFGRALDSPIREWLGHNVLDLGGHTYYRKTHTLIEAVNSCYFEGTPFDAGIHHRCWRDIGGWKCHGIFDVMAMWLFWGKPPEHVRLTDDRRAQVKAWVSRVSPK